MKKILFAIISIATMAFSSCTNDEILVETYAAEVKDAVTINVSLSNFFQSYNFLDTKHELNVADVYRTFHSESELLIQVQSLIYDKASGTLVKELKEYATSTNSVVFKADLPVGDYFVETSLMFANKDKKTLWVFENVNDLYSAKMVLNNNSMWGILSESIESVSVKRDANASVNTTPAPVGAVCYAYMHNFCYKDYAQYSTEHKLADNNIRKLAIYTQNKAVEYLINPAAPSRFGYLEDAGKNSWYSLTSMEPKNFDESWTHFKSNLYDYFYILSPTFNLKFGYVLEGKDGFTGYGEATYTLQNGKVYLAYWDWFAVGNPYFGIADNNHWNTY